MHPYKVQATLLQSYNTFGVPLGVTVSCLPKNEVVDTGDKYTFTTIPNTAVNTPSVLYEAGDTHTQAMEWMRNYGKFNAGNLRTQDVLRVGQKRKPVPVCVAALIHVLVAQVPGFPFVYVNENHPVINLLRINKNIVGVDVDEQDKVDKQFIKVTNSLFEASCDAIQNRVLDKIQTHDFNNLTVSLYPILLFFFALQTQI